MLLTPEEHKRIWEKVDKNGPNGCWLWTGAKTRGYGILSFKAKVTKAPWLFYAVHNNLDVVPFPKGMCVCHKCDNPTCVNPDHLYLGTPKDNTRDAMDRGRWCPSEFQKGEKNHRARFKEEDILEMRRLFSQGVTQDEIAELFYASSSAVCGIVRGKRWKHVGGEVKYIAQKLIPADTIHHVRLDYLKGYGVSYLAQKYNMGYNTVKTIISSTTYRTNDAPLPTNLTQLRNMIHSLEWLIRNPVFGTVKTKSISIGAAARIANCVPITISKRIGEGCIPFRLDGVGEYLLEFDDIAKFLGLPTSKQLGGGEICIQKLGSTLETKRNDRKFGLLATFIDDDLSNKILSYMSDYKIEEEEKVEKEELDEFVDESEYSEADINRFFVYVDKIPGGCWEWWPSKGKNEYGIFICGSRHFPHRFSYEFHTGEKIPTGMLVCHHCDNRSCVNPEHLYLGTQQDNVNDMVKRNRFNPKLGLETKRLNKLVKINNIRENILSTVSNIKRIGSTDYPVVHQVRNLQYMVFRYRSASAQEEVSFCKGYWMKISLQAKKYKPVRISVGKKLSSEQVIEIRRLLSEGYTGEELTRMFGVGRATISYIKHGQKWKFTTPIALSPPVPPCST